MICMGYLEQVMECVARVSASESSSPCLRTPTSPLIFSPQSPMLVARGAPRVAASTIAPTVASSSRFSACDSLASEAVSEAVNESAPEDGCRCDQKHPMPYVSSHLLDPQAVMID